MIRLATSVVVCVYVRLSFIVGGFGWFAGGWFLLGTLTLHVACVGSLL